MRAWLVSGSGVAVAALMIWANSADPAALHPPAVPLTAPVLPLCPAAGVLVGLLPAFVAPLPPRAEQPVETVEPLEKESGWVRTRKSPAPGAQPHTKESPQ
ncbi:hypothetical protein ADL35_05825 [Streptomyces sp. NRRL WC-3753]|nr:hypothetical protein ADL35_05825 [Streptomyces sp. NRRL WC-3753]